MAWELGGNLGHVAVMLAVARELRARGHGVVFALRDLTHAGLIARDKFAFFPAPVPVRVRRPQAANLSVLCRLIRRRDVPIR